MGTCGFTGCFACCLRALGGEAGFGAVGVVSWESVLQAVDLGLGEAEA